MEFLKLDAKAPDLEDWNAMVARVCNPGGEVRIAVVGKYIKLQDAYKSIYEALAHAGASCDFPGGDRGGVKVNIVRVEAEDLFKKGPAALEAVDGVLVPGGFGMRGIEGKVVAVKHARENRVPYLGICLGMQCAVIEFARNVLGLSDADSAEFNPDTTNPVIALLDDQKKVTAMGGTMRLGSFPCHVMPGSRVHAAYGADVVHERHRHRFEFNNEYRERFEAAHMRFTGLSPDGHLVEMVELADHPWFVATQAHPEFKSRPVAPHPLFKAFVEHVVKRRAESLASK
jgi:CTP synthase